MFSHSAISIVPVVFNFNVYMRQQYVVEKNLTESGGREGGSNNVYTCEQM
jgi:hypothetical protein